ncbi:MAG: hypothetical protein H0W87_01825 [Actinobacteria bacterium]|nr:hypothetical protein [Actinomycetota bacterium]
MTRTAGVVVAAILGIVGIALGSIALVRGHDGGDAFTKKTLTLKGGKGTRIEYDAPILVKREPGRRQGLGDQPSDLGRRDRRGHRRLVPLITNDVDCVGGFQLTDGDINVENIEQATATRTSAEGSILGGSGAYEGAFGSWTVDWKTHVYVIHLILPKT